MTRAFSLLELVLVLSIIGITALIAVPKYASSVTRFRVESAVSRVGEDIKLMRTRARAASEPRVITFDELTEAYSIAGERGLDLSSSYSVDLKSPPYNADIVLVDFAGNDHLTIDGFGTVSDTGRIVLRAGEHYRTLFVGTASESVEDGNQSVADDIDIGGGNLVPLN